MIRRKTDPTMKRIHSHSPVTIKLNDRTKYSINELGLVTITVDGPNDEFDEVTVPAYHIFKIGKMLNETRTSVRSIPREINHDEADKKSQS